MQCRTGRRGGGVSGRKRGLCTGNAATNREGPPGGHGGQAPAPDPARRAGHRDAGRTRGDQACQDAPRQRSREVAVTCPRCQACEDAVLRSLGPRPGPPTLPHALLVLGRTGPALCPGALTPTPKRPLPWGTHSHPQTRPSASQRCPWEAVGVGVTRRSAAGGGWGAAGGSAGASGAGAWSRLPRGRRWHGRVQAGESGRAVHTAPGG